MNIKQLLQDGWRFEYEEHRGVIKCVKGSERSLFAEIYAMPDEFVCAHKEGEAITAFLNAGGEMPDKKRVNETSLISQARKALNESYGISDPVLSLQLCLQSLIDAVELLAK